MEHVTILAVLLAAFGFLIFSRVPREWVGLGVVVALIFTGQATPQQALAGFAHPAVLVVASLLVISGGVQRTGVVEVVAAWMRRAAGRSERAFLALQTALVTPVSAFLSNTAVVAVFLPMVLAAARERNFSASRLLMPLSFASLLGGMCTLIGTSTNVVVANLAVDHGLAPLGMFEFAPVGALIAVIGVLYLLFVMPVLIPDRRPAGDLAGAYPLRRYLTEVEVMPGSHLAGLTLEASRLAASHDLEVLEIHRGTMRLSPVGGTVLMERDTLIVHAPIEAIRSVQEREGVRIRSEGKIDLPDLVGPGMRLAEAVVPPDSPLDGRTLKEAAFRNRFGVTALAIYHRREVVREKVGKVELRVGDVLLLHGSENRLKELDDSPEVVSLVQIHPPRARRRLAPVALGILCLTVFFTATGLVGIVKAVLLGAVLTLVTGCLTFREVPRQVDWRTLMLLASMIALGLAMERTGAALAFARSILESVGSMGPYSLLAATYLVTTLLTELITNNACAVIMTPIAIAAAQDSGLDPRPFVFAVAYGASSSFLTPIGYQTNTFVYGPGGYRFSDFIRVGFPLSLLAWGIVTIFAPLVWPFHP